MDTFRQFAGLDQYQELAGRTDQLRGALRDDVDPEDALRKLVPLLGMAGEVGSLLAEFKKYIRDGSGHPMFPDHVREELGDILWYLASAASRFDLDLAQLAIENLEKARRRWPAEGEEIPLYVLFDDDREEGEQLPRRFRAEVRDVEDVDGLWHAEITIDGVAAGDHLRDNSRAEDHYRFHDLFHLAHAALLGWSPVVRGKLLDPKRKRKRLVEGRRDDEVEDGGRAIVIEEAIVAYVWGYASQHEFLSDVTTIDYSVLKTIEQLTTGLEVRRRALYQWEEAILTGYEVFRAIRDAGGGVVEADLTERTFRLA
ncbi:MAG: MazG nucleotide pyrophosphohydrolase [Aeromicrobium sp.]|nr:MazG nucleotide pyrophosphohydrolase [Aeromicrobium sp.]